MRLERHVVFWIVAFLVFVGLLWLLHRVLLPFVVGAALAYLLDPLASRFAKRGLSRLFAALAILAAFLLVVAGVLVVVVPILANQLSAFIGNVSGYIQQLQAIVSDPSHPWIHRLVGSATGGLDLSAAKLANRAIEYLTAALPALLTKGEALLSIFSLLVITPVVAFYLLVDWGRVVKSFDDLVPLHQRDTVRGLAREINKALSGYVHGQLLVCAILGTYYAIGLTLAHLPYGLLIGVISGFLTFIPYVGSLTALVVSFAVALAQFYPEWAHILLIVGIVLVGQFLEGNVLAPKLVGESVGLHPVWLIFALLSFGYLLGFVGLLLAVPLAAAAGVLMRFAIRRYRESALYTGNGSG